VETSPSFSDVWMHLRYVRESQLITGRGDFPLRRVRIKDQRIYFALSIWLMLYSRPSLATDCV
jgi:hypothetical protein